MLLLLLLLMVTLATATTPVAATLALVWQFEGLSSFYAHSIHEVFLAAVFLEVILVGFLVDFARHLASFKLLSVVELDNDTTMFALMLLFEFLFVSLCTSSVVVVKFFFILVLLLLLSFRVGGKCRHCKGKLVKLATTELETWVDGAASERLLAVNFLAV